MRMMGWGTMVVVGGGGGSVWGGGGGHGKWAGALLGLLNWTRRLQRGEVGVRARVLPPIS